jgi:hypothetical protein
MHHRRRFFVSTWRGQDGAIFEVRDRLHPNACLHYYSTIRNGPLARRMAKAKARGMNQRWNEIYHTH